MAQLEQTSKVAFDCVVGLIVVIKIVVDFRFVEIGGNCNRPVVTLILGTGMVFLLRGGMFPPNVSPL